MPPGERCGLEAAPDIRRLRRAARRFDRPTFHLAGPVSGAAEVIGRCSRRRFRNITRPPIHEKAIAMSVILSLGSPEEAQAVRWATIQIPEGDFEIGIRPPTFEEMIADHEQIRTSLLNRMERHIVDWRGLNQKIVDTTDPANHVEKSEPLPFSFGDLRRICGQRRSVFSQVLAAVNRVYCGLAGR